MNSNKSVSCSFCKKDKNQTEILIAGDGAHICDVCIEKAHQIGFSGIGLSQRGDHAKRFVHLDTKPRKALWSY